MKNIINISSSINYTVLTTLSYDKLPGAVLAGNINNRFRKAGIIELDGNFLWHFGYPKKRGFEQIIQENFGDSIIISEENGVSYYQAKGGLIIKKLENILKDESDKNGGEVDLLDYWGIIHNFRIEEALGNNELWRLLGIRTKGPSHIKVRKILDRMKITYVIRGWKIDGERPIINVTKD